MCAGPDKRERRRVFFHTREELSPVVRLPGNQSEAIASLKLRAKLDMAVGFGEFAVQRSSRR